MITAYGSLDTAIRALKAGAFDFLTKPVDLGRCGSWWQPPCACATRKPRAPVDNRLLGESPPMRALRNQIGKLARSQAAGLHQWRVRRRQGTGGAPDP